MLTRSPLLAPVLALTVALAACGGGEAEPETEGMEGESAPAMESESGAESAMASAEQPTCWLSGEVTPEEAAQRPSPRDSASIQLDPGVVKICYGSPSVRDREIFGSLEEWDQPWRGGADEATALHLTFPAEVAGVALEPGSYSLYTVPHEDQPWEVVINSEAQRWGIPIDDDVQSQDIGSGTVTPEPTDGNVEMLRYTFEGQGEGEALLVLEWADTRLPIPITGQDS